MTKQKVPGYLEKKKHMQAVFILCGAAVAFLLLVLVSFGLQLQKAKSLSLVSIASSPAAQDITALSDSETPRKSVFAPNLVSLLGLSKDDAIESLGHGAVISSETTGKDVTGVTRAEVTVTLSNEPADRLAGTPTVYLYVNDDEKVVEAGFKAGMAYLGYGSLSFVDAIENAHVVEETLTEAGLSVENGTVFAPASKSEYATYGADGVTLEEESLMFSGTSDGHAWRAYLNYDYRKANSASNLVNTIRIISVYIHE